MTFEGRNFDIASGVTALVLAVFCARARSLLRGFILAWSILGLALLIHVVSIAILSAPGPLRAFHNDPPSTFIAYAPFVWLPGFLLQAAWFGHLLDLRLLIHSRIGRES